MQHKLSDLCHHSLVYAFERLFDRYAPTDGHLVIERLEIEAGTFTFESLEQGLIESVVQAVEKFLQEQSPSLNRMSEKNFSSNVQRKTDLQSIQDAFIYFLETGRLPWSFSLPTGRSLEQEILDSWKAVEESIIIRQSIKTTIVHAISSQTTRKRLIRQFSTNFMGDLLARLSPESKQAIDGVLKKLHGSDVPSKDVKYFERQLWEIMFASIAAHGDLTEKKLVGETWRSLSVPREQPTALEKLLERHWPGETKETFGNRFENTELSGSDSLVIKKKQNGIDVNPEIKEINKKSAQKNKSIDQLPTNTPIGERLDRSTAKIKQSNIDENIEIKEISKKSAQKNTSAEQLSTKSSTRKSSKGFITGRKHPAVDKQSKTTQGHNKGLTRKNKFIERSPSDASIEEQERTGMVEQTEASEISKSKILARFETKESLELNSEKSLFAQYDQIDLKEGVYINCAGLVLLHPFLPRFFETLGISVEDQITNPDRALCLLHFLATGQTVAPEYELILPKILCNVPLKAPVESVIELSSIELEEATALLEAVIHHWEVLRNTGMDGLRGTFLVRPGKLSLLEDGDWLLQVESQSFDILLEQLPWGISMIKLPWMPRMLRVEWAS